MAVGSTLLAETLSIEEERVMARPRQYGCVWQSPAAPAQSNTPAHAAPSPRGPSFDRGCARRDRVRGTVPRPNQETDQYDPVLVSQPLPRRARTPKSRTVPMKILSLIAALFGILALVLAQTGRDLSVAVLGGVALMCALTTFRSTSTSSFLKIFVSIFSTETIVFGFAVLAAREGLWPKAYADYVPPDSLPLTVAIFSMLIYFVARLPVLRQILRIADRYYEATERGGARIWPFAPYSAPERRIAIAMVVFLVLVNQVQVGITVRLSFFNRDWFNAIQNKDGSTFWHLLFFVFTPWALMSVTGAVIEFFVRSMLVIRWRRWLTNHFVSLWLGGHAHYRMGLIGTEADNPDQRIAEDVSQFIDAPEGNGIYSYSVLLIATVSSLVSFAIVLWDLSENFTLPGTDTHVPGFVFWIALLYAAGGTLITHAIGRPLILLYFERQHVEADFRFSLARLREYGEQVALLSGERTEQSTLRTRFGAIITNFLALVARRTKLMAFTATFGQISPIIPFIFTAPFYFAGKISLGIMIQTAEAFTRSRGGTHLLHQILHLAGGFQIGRRSSDLVRSGDRAGKGPRRRWPRARCRARRHGAGRARGCENYLAGRTAHRRGQTPFPGGRRKRSARRALGIRQIDLFPRDIRDLAVRRGAHPNS